MSSPEDGSAPARRKRMAFFRSGDASPIGPEIMSSAERGPAVLAGLAKLAAANVRAGIGEQGRVLFREPGESGFSLLHLWFKSGYVLPPHSHDGDCLYYVLGGELRMGSRVLRRGDGMFIPAGSGYTYEAGPEGVEVLEFRNATHFNIALRGEDEKSWDRMIEVFRDRAAIWEGETVPPSELPRT